MPVKQLLDLNGRAEGRVLRAGHTTIFCEGEVRSESGELVAKAIGTFRARNSK